LPVEDAIVATAVTAQIIGSGSWRWSRLTLQRRKAGAA
jgi:hypothetical protein